MRALDLARRENGPALASATFIDEAQERQSGGDDGQRTRLGDGSDPGARDLQDSTAWIRVPRVRIQGVEGKCIDASNETGCDVERRQRIKLEISRRAWLGGPRNQNAIQVQSERLVIS